MLLNNIDKVFEYIDQGFLTILNNNGIKTVSEFLCTDPVKVLKFSEDGCCQQKLNLKTILILRRYLFTHHASSAAGSWYSNNQISNKTLETDVKNIDKILNGGFKGGLVYEVYGLPGSGRTQLTLHLAAVNAIKGGNTLFIDTKNDFCVDRFCEVLATNLKSAKPTAKRIKLNCDENDELIESYLNKIKMAKVYEMELLLDTISGVLNDMNNLTCENDMVPESWKFYRNVRLLVLDNIASIVLPLLGNDRYTMSDITALTSQLIEKIRAIAIEHNVIVLVVNNIVMNNSTYARNFKDSKSNREIGPVSYKPSLGKFFSDAANIRLRIDYSKSHIEWKSQKDTTTNCGRKIIVEKDVISGNISHLNYKSCLIKLTNKGLEDVT